MSIKLFSPEFLFPTKIVKSFDTDFKSYRDDMIKWMIDYSYKNNAFYIKVGLDWVGDIPKYL